jgi:hypothetical protein
MTLSRKWTTATKTMSGRLALIVSPEVMRVWRQKGSVFVNAEEVAAATETVHGIRAQAEVAAGVAADLATTGSPSQIATGIANAATGTALALRTLSVDVTERETARIVSTIVLIPPGNLS